MINYSLVANSQMIARSDGALIPNDPSNTDYAAYLAWVAAGNTPAPAPAMGAAQQLALQVQNAISAGLTINSTSTPAINGLYAIDQPAQLNIAAVTNYVLVNNDFPGGVAAYPWLDLAGGFHVFPSVALFKLWATAIANYVAQLKLYAAGDPGVTLPAATVTIP